MCAPRRLVAILAVASAIGACADDDLGEASDAASGSDARAAARIQLPATDGELLLDFGISVTGDGSNRVGKLSILNGSGTVELVGRSVDVAAYVEQPWPEVGYSLYQALAVAEDRWFVVWFYCTDAALQHVYLEGTDGTSLGHEPASGTCSVSASPSAVSVRFPAVDMPPPRPVGRFTISGPEITLHGLDPGMVRLDGVDWVLLPFEYVNCTGGCEVGTWYELHAILADPDARRAAFGIFYMTVGEPSSVVLEYALSVPDLSRLVGTAAFAADWTFE